MNREMIIEDYRPEMDEEEQCFSMPKMFGTKLFVFDDEVEEDF